MRLSDLTKAQQRLLFTLGLNHHQGEARKFEHADPRIIASFLKKKLVTGGARFGSNSLCYEDLTERGTSLILASFDYRVVAKA